MAFKKPLADLDSFINGGEVELKVAPSNVIHENNPEPMPGVKVIAAESPVVINVAETEQSVPLIEKSPPQSKPKFNQAEISDRDEKEPVGTNKTIFSQSDEDFEAFRNYAFMKRTTKTSIIRKALKEYMEKHP